MLGEAEVCDNGSQHQTGCTQRVGCWAAASPPPPKIEV